MKHTISFTPRNSEDKPSMARLTRNRLIPTAGIRTGNRIHENADSNMICRTYTMTDKLSSLYSRVRLEGTHTQNDLPGIVLTIYLFSYLTCKHSSRCCRLSKRRETIHEQPSMRHLWCRIVTDTMRTIFGVYKERSDCTIDSDRATISYSYDKLRRFY